jgi:hypothetical protein
VATTQLEPLLEEPKKQLLVLPAAPLGRIVQLNPLRSHPV